MFSNMQAGRVKATHWSATTAGVILMVYRPILTLAPAVHVQINRQSHG